MGAVRIVFGAFQLLFYKRAKIFGAVEPRRYIFAGFKVSGRIDLDHMHIRGFDPTRLMRTCRKAWRNLTKQPGLPGLQFHDLRHHPITELAKSEAIEQTIMAIAGHVSRKMLERYSHIRMEAKRAALEAFSKQKPDVYDTIYGTNGEAIPVYTDLSSTSAKDTNPRKLEVATVPGLRPHPKFRTEW